MNSNTLFKTLAIVGITFFPLGAAPLTLSKAYELALENNNAYLSKKYQSDSAYYATKQIESKLFPRVQLALNGGYHDYVQNYDYQSDDSEIYKSYSLSLTQPLYRPEILTELHQGELRTQGAAAETFKSAQELGAEVAQAYFDLVLARRSADLARANFDFYALKYTRIAEMLSEGLSNKMDLLDTQLYRDRAMIEINTATKKEQLARRKLQNLIVSPVGDLPSLMPEIDIPEFDPIDSEETEQSPELQSAVVSREIAEAEVKLRKYEHYPKVDVSLTRTQNDTNDRTMYKTDNRAYLQISIPIYQGGYTSARIDEARLLQKAAELHEADVKSSLEQRLSELSEEYALIVQNLSILRTARKAARLNLTAVETAQKAGLKNQVDLLETQAKLYQTDQDTLKELSSLATNRINTLALVGKLDITLLETLEKLFFPSVAD